VRMFLVCGLNDEDTKVDNVTFDDTIAFIEARETDKNSVKILSGGGGSQCARERTLI
jgi:hypothetical protein